MKKIGFTIPNFDTAGSGKALLRLALSLNNSEFEPHIICKTNQGEFFKTVENSGIPVHVFEYQPKARPLSTFIVESWKISRKLNQLDLDLIHSFHYNNNYTEAVASRFSGTPWIFTKKNMMWGSKGANAWKIRSKLAKRIIIQNKDMKHQFYADTDKTVLIPRGIDIEKFAQGSSRQLEIDKNTNSRIVCAVAHLWPIKGIDILIRAFQKVSHHHNTWQLWIVGDTDTEHGRELQALVEKEHLANIVQFAGKVENVTDYLSRAEVFVLPTRSTGEGSPVALLEAMANGKAVIGSDVSGIRDQLESNLELLFEAENVQDLSGKLNQLMSNTTLENRAIGRNLQEHVKANFSLKLEVQRHEQLYREILGS